jgi:hypothetical protein
MNHKHTLVYFIITLMFTIPMAVQAGPPSNNPHVLDARVAALEALIVAQQDMIDELTTKLACVSAASSSAELFFEGCNVHVRNGVGTTDSLNSFGNLIVGYNEATDGQDQTGSHNLVVGPEHTYSSFGGFVAGISNSVTGPHSSVSGGEINTASGPFSSVSGGQNNTATGPDSSVSGGGGNTASGDRSSVSGGEINTASGPFSSVSGGFRNDARGGVSSVSGGQNNTATGPGSSVSGGRGNTATFNDSSILGGIGLFTASPGDTIPMLP